MAPKWLSLFSLLFSYRAFMLFNSAEAAILIIVMDPQIKLLSTISSSVIFLQGTTEPSDENKKFGYIKQKRIYEQQKIARYFCLKNFLQGFITSASAILVDFFPSL